jgi:hypothetical protein
MGRVGTEKPGAPVDPRPEAQRLLASIKASLPELEELLAKVNEDRGYEEMVYRFYHQSFKVYWVQDHTRAIVDALARLLPERTLNQWFTKIVEEGTGKEFKMEDNQRWLAVTRPMLEAFFHARYFLEMVCRYGREFEAPPALLPYGWGSVLYLWGLR